MSELKYFLTAVMFFSRIPVPRWVGYSEEQLNKSTKYFPLVGALVGGIAALGVWIFLQFLPVPLAIILSMLLSIWVTGAFHEDGFADFCDGYGGGYTKEKIMMIMKDSRLGTYGSIGLLGMLVTKFFCLQSMDLAQLPFYLVAGHVISRVPPVFLIFTSRYVREDDSSKSKPVGNAIKFGPLLLAVAFAVPFVLFMNLKTVLVAILALAIVFILFRSYVIKKTGGYTGDVLGALQQLSEITFYIVIVSMAYEGSSILNFDF